jgi:hypothetical protein
VWEFDPILELNTNICSQFIQSINCSSSTGVLIWISPSPLPKSIVNSPDRVPASPPQLAQSIQPHSHRKGGSERTGCFEARVQSTDGRGSWRGSCHRGSFIPFFSFSRQLLSHGSSYCYCHYHCTFPLLHKFYSILQCIFDTRPKSRKPPVLLYSYSLIPYQIFIFTIPYSH